MTYPKVTIVGAGQVGATAALLVLLRDLADVVLLDVTEGLPQGKALDLMHSRSVLGFGPRASGTNDYAETAGSDVIVVTAGLPRMPGMTRDDLLAKNASIVRSVVSQAVPQSPDAILLCVTNPLDVMVYLAWRESGLPASRVLGMGGVLDSARFAYAISEATGAPVNDVEAVVMGAHGDRMVPVPSASSVAGRPITEMLSTEQVDAVVERTVFGGAQVVSLLKTGSAFYAPAASVAEMVQAILADERVTMPSCVLLQDHYGMDDLYMSVPATLGRAGVVNVPEIALTGAELAALVESGASIATSLDALGLRT